MKKTFEKAMGWRDGAKVFAYDVSGKKIVVEFHHAGVRGEDSYWTYYAVDFPDEVCTTYIDLSHGTERGALLEALYEEIELYYGIFLDDPIWQEAV